MSVLQVSAGLPHMWPELGPANEHTQCDNMNLFKSMVHAIQ